MEKGFIASKVSEGQGESGDYQTELSQGQPQEIQSTLMSHHSLSSKAISSPNRVIHYGNLKVIFLILGIKKKPWNKW